MVKNGHYDSNEILRLTDNLVERFNSLHVNFLKI